jgi:hypothetical protein
MSTTTLRIANARGVPGTAGTLVCDAAGARFVLANHHVVFGGGAADGDRVWAVPPDVEDAEREAIWLGRARRGQIGRVTFGGETYFVDCALVELADATRFPSWLQTSVSGPWPSVAAAAAPGMRVVKNGVTTGRTEGVLVDVAYPDHPFVGGRWWDAPGQLLVDSLDPELNFSAPGDSGAALLDERGRVVGLLWGSNENGQGIACPIDPVLDSLGVTLATASRPAERYA